MHGTLEERVRIKRRSLLLFIYPYPISLLFGQFGEIYGSSGFPFSLPLFPMSDRLRNAKNLFLKDFLSLE